MSYFACCHWQAGQAQAGGLQLALPCLAQPARPAPSVPWYLPRQTHPPIHPCPWRPPLPMAPFPPSRYQGTAARATWCSGWGLGSGSLKSVVRACFFASSISRASPLLLLCPCSTPALLHEHDTTSLNKAWFGRRFFHQRPSRRPQAFHPSDVVTKPTVELSVPPSPRKNTREARAWIAFPQRLNPKPTNHDHAGPTQPP